jgi:flagellar motor switch protein FliG
VIERGALQYRLLGLIQKLPAVQVQNRLMASTDRDLALTLVGMTGEEQERVLAFISPRKAGRVREELALEERRHVEERHIIAALSVVIQSLQGSRSLSGPRSYVRPRRARPGEERD